MKSKITLALTIMVASIIFLAGCGKNNASLVGVWTVNNEREIVKTSGVVTYDTTAAITGSTITFTAAGTYATTSGGSTISSGTYTQSGNKLTSMATGSSTPGTLWINTLTDHNLQLESRDTTGANTTQLQYNLTR